MTVLGHETAGRRTDLGSSPATYFHLLRLLLGLSIAFWLWAKWLYSPQLVFLPPLPPVEVLISLVERVLGYWLVALIPLVGLILIVLDGLSFQREERLRWWGRRILRGSVAAALIHMGVWLLGSILFFVVLALAPGSDVRGRAIADPVVQGLVLFCAFLSLILAGPVTALVLVVGSLSLRSREGFPATRLEALNTLAVVLLVPLFVFWISSGDPAATLRALQRTGRGQGKASSVALVAAARQGDVEAVQALIRGGAQVNAKDDSGATALMAGAANGHLEIVRALIRAGANVNAHNETGRTALMSAAGNRYADMVRVLIEAGADVNAKDSDGRTALMLAASVGHAEISRALIRAGAEVNAKSVAGDTALMSAARGGHAGIVQLLIEAHADVTANDKNGDSALRMAAKMNHAEIVRILREAGAKN